MRTAFLLGAGASADAGLPLTSGLASELVKQFNQASRSQHEIAALNFIYGAMLSQRTDRGGSPFAPVNAETMISAVRLLRDRNDHEAGPFVQWKSPVNALDVKHSRAFDVQSRLADAIHETAGDDETSGPADELYEVLLDIIDDRTGSGGDGRVYEALELHLRTLLAHILRAIKDVNYLRPLVDLANTQEHGVDVVTLNYDLTVETAAREARVPVWRGIED